MGQMASISARSAAEVRWDAIIIGAGMGGAATAYELSRHDLRTLVIEKGRTDFPDSPDISKHIEDPAGRVNVGRWPTKIRGQVDGRNFDFFAPLGTGVGGSTLLYAAALDRFRQSDFMPRPLPGGGTLEWPISFEDFCPYYVMAERLLEVSGTADPLDNMNAPGLPEPPPLDSRDADIFAGFQKAGLHPYRLHSGYRFVDGCGPCLGRVCLRDCKRHAGNSFLTPAIATGRVSVLSDANVTRIDANGEKAFSVQVRVNNETTSLSASVFALAAGAYFSPTLLLNSKNEYWPQGLGNRHDQVGRNLMFHTSRSLAVWSKSSARNTGPSKSIVLRDFYDGPGGKFGEIQSTGAEAKYGNIIHALRQQLAESRYSRVPLLWHLVRIPAFAASRILGRAAVFGLIMEDLPYPENHVSLDPDAPSGMRFVYTSHDELRARFDAFSAAVSRELRGVRYLWLTHGLTLNYGHPMGTCRIGHDPATSVAGADGAVHGLSNLYIADSSFMPSSGGTNPSLTIAANGLRVGAAMAQFASRNSG